MKKIVSFLTVTLVAQGFFMGNQPPKVQAKPIPQEEQKLSLNNVDFATVKQNFIIAEYNEPFYGAGELPSLQTPPSTYNSPYYPSQDNSSWPRNQQEESNRWNEESKRRRQQQEYYQRQQEEAQRRDEEYRRQQQEYYRRQQEEYYRRQRQGY